MAPDASKLIRVHDITPVQVDLALTPEQPQQPALCNQMGYLPMTMANGKMHDQPFLINPNASDMIMSPEAILQASSTFHRFEQLGFKSDQPGNVRFYSCDGDLLMNLDLFKDNGLYYFNHAAISYDADCIRTTCSVNAAAAQASLEDDVVDDSVVHATIASLREMCVEDDSVLPCDCQISTSAVLLDGVTPKRHPCDADLWSRQSN